MIVKICGITSLEDALAAAGAGANALGFNFYRSSPRFLEPAQVARIVEQLPGGVLKAGVFVDMEPDKVVEFVRNLGLDVAQIHRGQLPRGIRAWKAFHLRSSSDLEEIERCPAEAVLLDTPAEGVLGGSGKTFDWSLARAVPAKKIVLAGGLDAGNVGEAIEQVRPWGVDACSRLESAPGRKDHRKMTRFIQAALAGFERL